MHEAIIPEFETTVEYAFKPHQGYENMVHVYVYNQIKLPKAEDYLNRHHELIHHIQDIHNVEVLNVKYEGVELWLRMRREL